MKFLIADTFTDSLARLTADEQKAVKTSAFDLQMNPAQPGLKFHKLDKARDKRFWSVRGTLDLRIIVHRSNDKMLLCYAGHHDDAYDWAERRKIEIHPSTGAAQLVEIRETVQEIVVPKYVEMEQRTPPKRKLFGSISDDILLQYGVPPEWLDDVRNATEDTYLELTDHLPREAAEALLEVATGGKPFVSAPALTGADPFQHPDAQRRFRILSNVEELQRALEFPWDQWSIFLHPVQRALVERDYGGPTRVSGSAGTGKTVVALHRAAFLARKHPEARVLLTTFSDPLASALRTKLRRLISNEPMLAERLEVHSITSIAMRLFERNLGPIKIVSSDTVRSLLKQAAATLGETKFSLRFLTAEWEHVVDSWQLASWESYRDVMRLGRKTRLTEAQRASLWPIFERAQEALQSAGSMTLSGLFSALASTIAKVDRPPFDCVVVDEAQDLSMAQLQFLASLGGRRRNGLFFAGDLGQRIFQQPFSWKALGVDIRGRSSTLKINYRTSHQIRAQADQLLAPEISDVDGITEERCGTVSTFNGPSPEIRAFDDREAEIRAVGEWIAARVRDGVAPQEVGVFVRTREQFDRASSALDVAGVPFRMLDQNVETVAGCASISTMHLAKGLEFRAVAVMACDDEIIPLQERLENVGDDADLAEVYATERHLLYVACTRARDHLVVTGVEPASEFLDDLREGRELGVA